MNLAELIPELPTFHLSLKGKDYTLRVPNLEDRMAIERLCGGKDAMQAMFRDRKWDQMCRIVYYLFNDADRAEFRAKSEKRMNEEGIEQEVLVLGNVQLLRSIANLDEATGMLKALTAAIVASEPVAKDYIQSELKKNPLNTESLTGENITMFSPPSTGLPPQTLESSHSARST